MNDTVEKHLLMIVHRIPYPPDKGDKIRSFHEFRFLRKKGWKIHLCTFIDDPDDLRHIEWLRTKCETSAFFRIGKLNRYFSMLKSFLGGQPLSIGAFYSKKALQYVQTVLSDYPVKAVLCFSSPTAEYLFQSDLPMTDYRTVMDLIDVDSDKWRLYADRSGYPRRWIYALESRRLAMYEKRIVDTFDAVTLVSEAESRLLSKRTEKKQKIRPVPNGVDSVFFHPAPEGTDARAKEIFSLVFCGLMDYYPNVDAVTWFVNEVLPRIRNRFDKAEFRIVGARPSKQVLDLESHPGVKVLGRVDDVRPYIWEAAISVAPLRVARGIQNKVLEAMAMAKPIVATEQAFEGIEAVPGRDLMVTKADPEAFANAIFDIWEHPNMARDMGKNARKIVETDYDWNARLEGLHEMLTADRGDYSPNCNSD